MSKISAGMLAADLKSAAQRGITNPARAGCTFSEHERMSFKVNSFIIHLLPLFYPAAHEWASRDKLVRLQPCFHPAARAAKNFAKNLLLGGECDRISPIIRRSRSFMTVTATHKFYAI